LTSDPSKENVPVGGSATAVSVVIPCFNLGAFLPEAVESVWTQTCPPVEIIVVDDGSTDDETLRVLAELRRSGLTVLRTDNRGVSAARNYGTSTARGEHILLLDADDVLLPRFLEETVLRLNETPAAGFVTTNYERFGEHGGIQELYDYDPITLLWRGGIIPSSTVFRRVCWEQIQGFREDLRAMNDREFWISIVESGWTWALVREPLCRYRVRTGSLSEFRRANELDLLRKIVDVHAETYQAYCADVIFEMNQEIRRLRRALKCATVPTEHTTQT
jgi:glycosyltransferase involved in cell wall biosynthesis